ncbi:MAG TPA: hypothetical protein VKU00_20180 [Chthonomonadaceae bacterium]|nr:hypothetical protein [Chthonomonadaceae bacterium]
MPDPSNDQPILPPEEHGRLAKAVMRRQAALSLRVAVIFLLLLIGLPLFNLYGASIANTRIFGMSATWLFLGILFFPITWLLSAYFVRESDRIEGESARWRDEISAYVQANTEEDAQ